MLNKKNKPSMEKNALFSKESMTMSKEERDLMPEPKSLLEGMRTVLDYVRNSALCKDYFDNVKVAMGYLTRRLNLTPTQVSLLAIILEEGFDKHISISDMADYLDITKLEMVEKSAELTVLQTRRFIVEGSGRFSSGYTAPKEVYDAFRRNEVYAYKVPEVRNDDELVERIDGMLSKLDNSNSEEDAENFDRDLRDLLNTNARIRLSRTFLSALRRLNDKEFRLLVLMSMLWIRDDEEDIPAHRFSIVLKRQLDVRQMSGNLQKGRSTLVKKGYVTLAEGGVFLTKDVFSLTPQFRKTLTPDRTVVRDEDELLKSRLMSHTDIREKHMFYNPEAVDEVERLTQLLQPEQMDGVLARLKEHGMRGGFTCLLYGGPGTGKTETVLQLARRSGRDIFQIDVSQLRTKWYGESERLVKGVFDDYRRMVKKSKVAPIMFFNEADAIFNRRMENAQRSVDKGENALQNIILQEMETLDGILIATTNLQENLDAAFERRFLYKLELNNPTPEVKAHIWQSMMPDLKEDEARQLAGEFDFSGGQIENIVRKRFIDEVLGGGTVDIEGLRSLCRHEQLENKRRQNIGFMRHAG